MTDILCQNRQGCYEYRTVTKRVRMISMHRIKGDIVDVTFQVRKRAKKPVLPGGLVFHERGNTVIWEDDSIRLSPIVFRFVQQFWTVPDRFLSKEDIRQDVMLDDEASESALRGLIARSRKELKVGYFPFEILTERARGYRLATKNDRMNALGVE